MVINLLFSMHWQNPFNLENKSMNFYTKNTTFRGVKDKGYGGPPEFEPRTNRL